jgi:hypothetical protein
MSDHERGGRLGGEGVSYFGGVAAGLSHELSNVFNIINEIAGLQHDIASAAAESGDARVARLADLAGRIKAQVSRGEEINRRLHHFAHSIDDTMVTFDLAELLELLAFLEGRSARLAGVDLVMTPPRDEIALTGDPFALLLAIHGCVRPMLQAAGSGSRVEVAAEPCEGGARIRIRCEADRDASEAPVSPALRAGAEAWRARVETEPSSAGTASVTITLPALPPRPPHAAGAQPPGEE